MFYNIGVKIIDSPTKIKEWRFLTYADTKEEADDMALSFAREKALRPYSRYRNCSFEIEKEDN